jgi:hypothetical protein
VQVTMTAQPQRPLSPDDGRVGGLKGVTHVIAVSSCKGGARKRPGPAHRSARACMRPGRAMLGRGQLLGSLPV